ncbi:hypothetical protein CROQUDRAFT_89416 [Cronartium quercuum f. sp. fusiforme G11]|uniref:Uncharacterized protein n=1 Tax=Cronartium quercuum f. sp. fusiforme G11 TaxID=708437 RepID=A0A9P6NLL1_9BASI|nr:hypothetical protein CROQUDRAFT_89416 [Cronartium quercuum f. sp. fusiforme G11]
MTLASTGVKTDDDDDEMISYFIPHLLPKTLSNLKIMMTHVSISPSITSALSIKRSTNRWAICSQKKHNPETAHSEEQGFQLQPELRKL